MILDQQYGIGRVAGFSHLNMYYRPLFVSLIDAQSKEHGFYGAPVFFTHGKENIEEGIEHVA